MVHSSVDLTHLQASRHQQRGGATPIGGPSGGRSAGIGGGAARPRIVWRTARQPPQIHELRKSLVCERLLTSRMMASDGLMGRHPVLQKLADFLPFLLLVHVFTVVVLVWSCWLSSVVFIARADATVAATPLRCCNGSIAMLRGCLSRPCVTSCFAESCHVVLKSWLVGSRRPEKLARRVMSS